ncbi:response regulator transcription factor [Lederbergia lenta]|uniref:Two-component response regulator n=1 Tax=Lederbergia lenta TaxID=1467 RepID=A0A2X4W5P1_LEDLE|nr:response regulator [Lederbergia lenta]MCM3112444.1 response regulator [Lederbergia lenta]MEC2323477.1 response regulator [Lederbergia lenta]SQI52920.1 two-component response regulator [Lederbergia lenta]
MLKEVLVVEDEMIIRQGLKVLLEDVLGGFQVTEAKSGEEGLLHIRQQLPHLIITDIRMGGMDGLAFTAKVRQVSKDIPIIILSGYSDFEYARSAMRQGISEYLLKPVNRTELSEVISKIFKPTEVESIDTSKHFQKIIQYIQENLSKEITLHHLADYVDLHPQYIGQLFKSELDQSFTEYMKEQRLKRAKELLRDTQLKVYEVANLSGYKSPKHFMTIFKQKVGKTPIQFRNLT